MGTLVSLLPQAVMLTDLEVMAVSRHSPVVTMLCSQPVSTIVLKIFRSDGGALAESAAVVFEVSESRATAMDAKASTSSSG